MRGSDAVAGSLFSYIDLEKRVRADHPLRVIRADRQYGAQIAVQRVRAALFAARPRVDPAGAAAAGVAAAGVLLDPLGAADWSSGSTIDLLFRWFVGLGIEDPVWDATTFTKNRDRLLEGDIAAQFLAAVLAQDKVKALLSSEHFSVDGTLLEAWASLKSFRPKDGSGEPPDPGRNGERDFHGERRSNDTHVSTTDPEARLFRKGPGKEARLCFMGHALMENRNGLIVGAVTTPLRAMPSGWAALTLIEPHAATPHRSRSRSRSAPTRAIDSADFVTELRDKAVTPHVAQNTSGRRSAIDDRTTRHPGYAISQRIRKRVEEAFGWAKTVAGLRKMRHRGLPKVDWQFTLAMAAYNLVRLPKLLAAAA